MRFLHTGDWHVGRTIRGRSRLDEFSAALDEVVAIARDEAVDAVLVAGDLYDQRAVTADADRLVLDTLLRLADLGAAVVAIPGNHDSAARLDAFTPLMARVGVTLVAKMLPPDRGGIVDIDGARIACLPFISPRRFSDGTQLFEDTAKGYVDFDEGVGQLLSIYENAFDPKRVNIVMGHMFIHGAEPGLTEREITIGDDYAVSAVRLPGTAHYAALGHIHKPQTVRAAPCPTRYCGSLLQLDFGERGQDKSVVVVDAWPGRKATTRMVALTAGRRLRDVGGTIAELETIAAGDDYLRVTVKVDGPTPGIADVVREILPNALEVRLDYDREAGPPSPPPTPTTPREQFKAYYVHAHGVEAPDELLGAFDRVYEEVTAT